MIKKVSLVVVQYVLFGDDENIENHVIASKL